MHSRKLPFAHNAAMQLPLLRHISTYRAHTPTPSRNIKFSSCRHLTFTRPRDTSHRATHSISQHLAKLNKEQIQAILSDPFGALQILAGPGTGKTLVMALRAAKLIKVDHIPPELIFLVTFGRSPAEELRTRLYGIIGQELTDRLNLGTIHGTCFRYVKGHKTPEVSLWTEGMHRRNIKHITMCHVSEEVLNESLVSNIQQAVARVKVYAGTHHSRLDFIYRSLRLEISYDTFERIILDHQETMKHSKALDFDDLVNECRELIDQKRWLFSGTQHILVDEFQDTNLAQYKLIRSIARVSKCGITVVGDPDQAIYGWRFADRENFQRMCADFPHTRVTNLELNYRSTPSILNLAHAVIAQDESRPSRTLHAFQACPAGPLPTLQQQLTIEEEANAIATRIQDMHGKSNGALGYGDFAILLRYHHWKQPFEDSLGRQGVPFQILPKLSFYTKDVVHDVLAYVFLAFSPQATPWLLRILDNASAIDSETVKNIQRLALVHKKTAMDIVRLMAYDASYKVNSYAQCQFQRLVVLLDYIKREGRNGALPSHILEYIIKHTNFTTYLKRRMRGYNFPQCWREIQILVHEARKFETSEVVAYSTFTPMDAYIHHVEELSKEAKMFDTQSVNIMTVHASKGLEFPVVFIPGVINGVYPRSKRRVEYEEDRRLLYVACTRPKAELHLTYPEYKDAEITRERAELSEFMDKVDPHLYQTLSN
ncbi:UvrD/REP helicase [Rhizoctonia solani AG-3 Rhs1AP]|uniref:DNA 3'-5' helicase n=1 Tax=Rhizoctonia solani AG-3 Rhs1AP TaxID=1086054 RepID=X8J3J3_9AGAM|nr:UvrD/REP helicase [Rhizoctonia solani AG-3 Rhs1AP]